MTPASSSTQPQVQIDTTLPPGLTAAQRDRIFAYRTAIAQGLSPDSAMAIVTSLAQKPQPGGVWNGVKRLLLKPMMQAPVDLLRMASLGIGGTDPATIAVNSGKEAMADQGIGSTPSSSLYQGINTLIPQEPQGRGERMVAMGVRGATGGALMGPGAPVRAAVSGGLAGLGGQGSAELGAPPEAQMLAAILAGLVPSGAQMLANRMGPANQAARAYGGAVKAVGDNPTTQLQQGLAMAKADPTLQGREVLGPQGQALALRVAREGGSAAEPMLNRTADQADLLAQQYQNRKNVVAGEQATGKLAAQQALKAKMDSRIQALKQQTAKAFSQQVRDIVQSPPDAGGIAVEKALERVYTPKVEKAYSLIDNAEVQTTPELERLMAPFARDWDAARNIANLRVKNGQPVPETPPLMEQRSQSQDFITSLMPGEQAPTRTAMPRSLPLRGYDALKQYLQARRFDQSLDEGQRTEATAALSRLDEIITNHVDPQVPGYASAREIAADYIHTRDALAFGRGLAEPAKARTETRGQVDVRSASQPDEVRQVMGDMTPDQLHAARLGYLYAKLGKIARSQTPWKEVADIGRAEGLLTPEEVAQINSASIRAQSTAKGIGDATLNRLRMQATELRTQQGMPDPELQRIQERARATDQVLEAANPKTATERVGAARKILTDVMVRAMKSAARDINMATAGRTLKPKVRGQLGNALSAQGPDLEAVIADWVQRLNASSRAGESAAASLPAATTRRQ